MELPEKYTKKSAPVYILPIVYEGMISWSSSDDNAAIEILDASLHLEHYDEEFDTEACYDGIHTLEPLNLNKLSPEEAVDVIKEELSKYKAKFVITVGSDQGLGIGCMQSQTKPFSVLHFSAHPHLFPSWDGSNIDEHCFGYHAMNEAEKLAQVGIRAMEHDEKILIEEEDNVFAVGHQGLMAVQGALAKILNHLTDNVFIEFDVSVFDPSLIRNTDNPVPNGMQWQQVIDILKGVFEHKHVIGVHICGFYPEENYDVESFAIAELIYKIISMRKVYTDS